ncbi:hypothetical protein CSA37_06235 [Candidatus Fermentibacteria bacterium]|nr:MAG: hypothetical protein CSA37_06235 [Candidatus Fermentibacteria bacterium]
MISGILLIVMQLTLEPLTSRLENISYLTGSFTQTDYWALTLDSETTGGNLHLAHPNLFLLEYSDVPGRSTGCTGEGVFTVDPEFQEILLYEGSPEGFLHILNSGDESSSETDITSSGDSVTVTMTGSFDGGITGITAGYTLSDSLPFLLVTVDANGNSTRWDIRDLEVHDSVPDIFKVPELPGYSVVDAGSV